MATRIRCRLRLPVLLAGAWLGWSAADGTAQQLPLPGTTGAPPLFAPGAPLPSPAFNGSPGLPPPTTTAPPAVSSASLPLVLPPLTVPATVHFEAARNQAPGAAAPPAVPHPGSVRLTLDEAKHRALESSKLLAIGNLNVQAKEYAVRAARADYFPKVTGSLLYYHFNDDLGTVLTAGGRTVRGPRGTPLLTFPTTTVNEAVLNHNSELSILTAVQPITDLLKVRQGVKIAQADERIAQAELEKGIRELVSGVEQLYWGLLAAQRIRAGAIDGVRGAELQAKTGNLEARTGLLEAQQGLQQVEKQVADLQEQLSGLLDLPLCTVFDLVEPPLPELPYRCADEVIALALEASPEIRQAQHTIAKAEAARAAGRLDYVPSIAIMGGYANQTAASYIQQDIGFVGVVGSYTFVDWGKRRNVIRERDNLVTMASLIRERDNLVTMASLKLQQTQADVRQKAQKAFRELQQSRAALRTAQEMAALRVEAEKNAKTVPAITAAVKARMLADVDAIKAELTYREAYVQVTTLIGGPDCVRAGHH
jgi:outer membrane protein TolC